VEVPTKSIRKLMALRPYARVYYIDMETDHPEVWRDDEALATWVRLLVVAEAMWPAVPEIPRSAKDASVRKLVRSGLVIPVAPFGFCIKGLNAERSARSIAGRIAGENRWRKEKGIAPLTSAEIANLVPRARDQAQPSNAKPSNPLRIAESDFPTIRESTQ
jgi:hypothetical protein